MEKTDECCMDCRYLGECKIVTLYMLAEDGVCSDWSRAETPVIEARKEARERTGSRALKAMMLKDPPKKPARKRRR